MSDSTHASAAHDAPHDHRKDYIRIFFALLVLTIVEVGITFLKIDRRVFVALMIGLALTKAALVGLYFMHLKYEKRGLLWLAAIPLPLAGLYAVVLMADAHNLIRVLTSPFTHHP